MKYSKKRSKRKSYKKRVSYKKRSNRKRTSYNKRVSYKKRSHNRKISRSKKRSNRKSYKKRSNRKISRSKKCDYSKRKNNCSMIKKKSRGRYKNYCKKIGGAVLMNDDMQLAMALSESTALQKKREDEEVQLSMALSESRSEQKRLEAVTTADYGQFRQNESPWWYPTSVIDTIYPGALTDVTAAASLFAPMGLEWMGMRWDAESNTVPSAPPTNLTEQLATKAHMLELTIEEGTDATGSCQFDSIAHQLNARFGESTNKNNVRREVCEWIQSNPDHPFDFDMFGTDGSNDNDVPLSLIEAIRITTGNSLDEYVNKMKELNEWGDLFTLWAATHQYNICIYLIQVWSGITPQQGFLSINPENVGYNRIIYIGHILEIHYHSLIPI